MAENDIYDTKSKYDFFTKNYQEFGKKPEERINIDRGRKSKYYSQNKENLKYFPKLFKMFDPKDLSYVRRMRLVNTFKIICYAAKKDLKDCEREDVSEIVAFMHTVNKSVKSKQDFIIDIKYLWKNIFPEKDEKDRVDNSIVPYPVRHLSGKIDISKEKRRDDKLTIEELEALIKVFSQDIRIQAYLALAFESLGRPQEILYTKIKDVELSDNYGKIWISEHGKEGTGFLEVIDSFPYVAAWYNKHPLRHDKDAFFFINLGNLGKYKQLRPHTINKHIREKLMMLKIKKPVTCYSLKRSGVTFRRLRGDSDVLIQHTARWTSTKQLKTYDLSQHDETFKIQLAKRGLVKDDKYKEYQVTTKKCAFCEAINGIGDDFCKICKRPLDRKKILEDMQNKEFEVQNLRQEMETWKQEIIKTVASDLRKKLKTTS